MPRRRPLALMAALLATVLALAACTDPDQGVLPGSFDVLEAAQDVPLVATQSLSLMNRMDDGLTLATAQSAGLDMATLQAVDFDGYPFVNITFTAPGPIGNVWEYATTLTPEAWEATDEQDSPYGTVITGASTARTPVSLISSDLAILLDFSATLQALGGEERLDAIVAATPTTLLMRDTTGAYWDTSTAELANPDELQAAIAHYAGMRDANNTSELLNELGQHWTQLLDAQAEGMGAAGISMSGFIADDGSLDLSTALLTLEEQQPLVNQRIDSRQNVCSYFLWIRICHTVETGSITDAHQGHDNSGAYQFPSAFGLSGTFNMPVCVTGGTQRNAPAGCGPTAFASLLWADWAKGEAYLGLKYGTDNPTPQPPADEPPTAKPPADDPPRDDQPSTDPPRGGHPLLCRISPRSCEADQPGTSDPIGCIGRAWLCSPFTPRAATQALQAPAPQPTADMQAARTRYDRSPDGLLAALMQPDSRGVPLLSAYMGACYFVSGSMSTPAGFVNGANTFLKDQGKQASSRGVGNRIRLSGNTSYLLGNPLTAGTKATMLRTQLGQRNNPMVALYWPKGVLSTAGAHYSLIEQYRITSGGNYLVPDVAIMAMDTPRFHNGRRIWHSLTDVWLPATGVYYIDRY